MIKKIYKTIKNKFSAESNDFLLAGDTKEEEKEILKKVVELSNQDQREVIDEYQRKHAN